MFVVKSHNSEIYHFPFPFPLPFLLIQFWRVVLYMATIAAYCALLLAVYLATKSIWRFEVKFPFRPDKPLQLDVAG